MGGSCMYTHIIWDFDGTLFDTYPVMAGVLKDMFEEIGVYERLEAILHNMKISIGHAIQEYTEKYHITASFLQEYKQRNHEAALKQTKPYPGIGELCRHIASTGRFNYLYTHRGETALQLLKKHELYDYFRDFITSQQGFPRKPDPEALNYLARKYDMKREEALMIGDRDLDILAAVNAGIGTCFFKEYDSVVHADHTIVAFDELYDIL